MALSKLLLHPADSLAAPQDPGALRAALAQIGLLGPAFQYQGREHHQVGDRFLDLITFLGCSPVVALAPAAPEQSPVEVAEEFCHLCLVDRRPAPRCILGRNAVAPRCRRCRRPQEQWQQRLPAWLAQPLAQQDSCPGCGQTFAPAALDWRHSAGCAVFFLEIWGIYPAEAVPSERLIATLEATTSSSWRYFYYLP